MSTLEQMIHDNIGAQFLELLDIDIKEVSKDRVVATMRVRPDLCTASGTLHGGACMALANTIGALATVINLPSNTRTSTIESKTNFVGVAPSNTTVIAESIPLHRGKSSQVWQTMIKSEAGKLCAVVTQTQLLFAVG